MNALAILACLLAVAAAAPQQNPHIEIVHQENAIHPDGSFRFSYESGDGTMVEQEGVLKSEEDGEIMQGHYSFIGDDGKTYSVFYTADHEGFKAEGDHIPVIPPAVLQTLAWNEAHPEEDNL